MSGQTIAPRILLVGATGFVGGTVLHRLIAGPDALPVGHTVGVLLRGENRALKLKEAYGNRVHPILISSLDDTATVERIASQHDIVINASTGFHESAVAMVRGLSKRHQDDGSNHQPWMIHISGCSNVADAPLSGESHPDRWFNDSDPLSIYEFEKTENETRPYLQRTIELAVLDTGEETGVKTISLQPPNIVGQGSGLFSISPSNTPLLFRFILEKGYGFQLGDGTGSIGFVHVDDLADLYLLLVKRILEGQDEDLPHGRRGIIFPCAESGPVKWTDMLLGCLEAAFKRGLLPKEGGPQAKEVRKIEVDDFLDYMLAGAEATSLSRFVAGVYAAHCNSIGTVAKQLGWKQTHGLEWLQNDYDHELTAILEGKRQAHMTSIIAEG